MPDPTATLLHLSQQLLDAIDAGDWETYTALCDPSLTAFEPEAVGHLVAGMPFHRFYFDLDGDGLGRPSYNGGRAQRSTISSPDVRVMENSAVVCYVRLVQRLTPDGRPETVAFDETRVWEKRDGGWRHVHFHRSTAS
jgi:Calcium/calmodulin dependent protein kinase II association domain